MSNKMLLRFCFKEYSDPLIRSKIYHEFFGGGLTLESEDGINASALFAG